MLHRIPRPELQPYVKSMWASARPVGTCGGQELTLPNENACIVVRLDGSSLDLVQDDGTVRSVGQAVIEGVQTRAFVKQRNCSSAVGAVLMPGALPSLARANATDFTSAHAPLDDVVDTRGLIETLTQEADLERRLRIFEAFLLTLVSPQIVAHPVVLSALRRLNHEVRIRDIVEAAGMSHRHFNHLFTLSVGVSPKYYQRLLRMHRGLSRLAREGDATWSDLALSSGYADQPHFNREFKALTGLTPSTYARSARRGPLHVIC